MADQQREVKIKLQITDDGTIRVLSQTGEEFDRLGVKARGAAGDFARLSGAVAAGNLIGKAVADGMTAAYNATVGVTKAAIEQADHLNKLSQQIGIGVKELTGYSVAAKLADVDLGTFSQSIGKLSKALVAGSDTLKAAGITATTTSGALAQLADVFQRLPDGTTKTALALDVFGRSGKAMIPLLNQGSVAIQEQQRLAEQLGLTYDNNVSRSAERFNDTLKLVELGVKGLGNDIMVALLPTLEQSANGMLAWEQANRAWIASDVTAGVQGLISTFAMLGQAITTTRLAWDGMRDAMGTLNTPLQTDRGALTEGAAARLQNDPVLRAQIETMRRQNAALMREGGFSSEQFSTPVGNSYEVLASTPSGGSMSQGLDSALEARIRSSLAPGTGAAASAKAAAKDAQDSFKAAQKQAEESAKSFAEADKIRYESAKSAAEAELDYLQQRKASVDELMVAYSRVQEIERQRLESERQQLELGIKASSLNFVGVSAGQREEWTARLEAVKQKLAELPVEADRFRESLERAQMTTVDLSRSISGNLKSALTSMMARDGSFGIEDLVKGTGKQITAELVGGFADSLLAKNAFDMQISENFTVTLPGFMRTGAEMISSIWSGLFGSMTNTSNASMSNMAGSMRNTVDNIGGLLRNIPGIGNLFAGVATGGYQVANAAGVGMSVPADIGLASGVNGDLLAGGSSILSGGAAGSIGGVGGAGAMGALGAVAGIGAMVAGLGLLTAKDPLKLERITGDSVGGGAATGAIYGSIVPGIGTMVGAIVGAIIGALKDKPTPEDERLQGFGKFFNKTDVNFGLAPSISKYRDRWQDTVLGRDIGTLMARSPNAPELQGLFANVRSGRADAAMSKLDQAKALGYLVSGGELGTGEEFGNTVTNNLAAMGASSEKTTEWLLKMAKAAGYDLSSSIDLLNRQLGTGKLQMAEYKWLLGNTVKLFSEDLPPGVDAAALAMKMLGNSTEGLNLKKFNAELQTQVDIFSKLQDAIKSGVGAGVAGYAGIIGTRTMTDKQLLDAKSGKFSIDVLVSNVAITTKAQEALRQGIRSSVTQGLVEALNSSVTSQITGGEAFKSLATDVAAIVNGGGSVGDIDAKIEKFINAVLPTVARTGDVIAALARLEARNPSTFYGSAEGIGTFLKDRDYAQLTPSQRLAFERNRIASTKAKIAELRADDIPDIQQAVQFRELFAELESGGKAELALADSYGSRSVKGRLLEAEGRNTLREAQKGYQQFGDFLKANTSALVENTQATKENTATARMHGPVGAGPIKVHVNVAGAGDGTVGDSMDAAGSMVEGMIRRDPRIRASLRQAYRGF